MASAAGTLKKISEASYLTYNSRYLVVYGDYGTGRNYTLYIDGKDSKDNQPHLMLSLCADKMESQDLPRKIYNLLPDSSWKLSAEKFKLFVYIPLKGTEHAIAEKTVKFMNDLVYALEYENAANCDETGILDYTDVYRTQFGYNIMSLNTAQRYREKIQGEMNDYAMIQERFIPGMLSSLAFTAAASLIVLLVARLGIISSLLSIILAAAVVYGYKWQGKKISVISRIYCLILGIFSFYAVFRTDSAMSLVKVFKEAGVEAGFGECLANSRNYYELAGALSTYNGNFIKFIGIGTAVTAVILGLDYSAQKNRFSMEKMV